MHGLIETLIASMNRMHPQLFLIGNLKILEELKTNDNNNIFISYIKYTNITPPANSKANRGR